MTSIHFRYAQLRNRGLHTLPLSTGLRQVAESGFSLEIESVTRYRSNLALHGRFGRMLLAALVRKQSQPANGNFTIRPAFQDIGVEPEYSVIVILRDGVGLIGKDAEKMAQALVGSPMVHRVSSV